MTAPPIILASASPRRKQLLTQAGYKFTVVPSQIDESSFSTQGVSPIDYAKQLALAKAKDVARKHPDSLVIGADTVVDFDGLIVGKPADAKDAEAITRMLFSKPHKVITGLALVCKNSTHCSADNNSQCHFERAVGESRNLFLNRFLRSVPKKRDSGRNDNDVTLQIVEADTTVVYPKKLTDSQIAAHIASGIWQDKAGAYAIKEHDDPFVDHIEGSLTNVMGLPMELIRQMMQQIT